ncbi:unnamed protein product [Phaedon cochleariae]|uniref:Guanylate cyclase n=1 Tax=Phaedon cochleariae TaxID=80249 RepID=A0A9N9WZ66_PHACE|nr:unnamed protein product [Phaedon cochleariae]
MILFIFLLLFQTSSASSGFNNSILSQPPLAVADCPPLPETCRNNNSTCPLCDDSGKCTLYVAVILPQSDFYIVNIARAAEILYEAGNKSIADGTLGKNISVDYRFYDDSCKQDKASGNLVLATKDDLCIHVMFGPVCDYCIGTIGRTAKYIDIPNLTPTALSSDFTKIKQSLDDEYYFLLNSGSTDFRSVAEFFELILDRYGWRKFILMYERYQQEEVGGEDTCYLGMSSLATELGKFQPDFVDGDLRLLGMNYTEFLMNKVGVDYGIIITCTNQTNMRKIAIEAAKLKMMDRGEYTFFNLELYNNATNPSRPWLCTNDTDENNALARKGYEAIYTIMPHSETNFSMVASQPKRGSMFLDGLYDAMMMYVQALNRTLNRSGAIGKQDISGCELVHEMMGKSFKGKNEEFEVNCNGIRVRKFAMLNINSEGDYEIMATYSTRNKTIDYWNIRWRFGEPGDTPACGYDLSKCPTYDIVMILVGCLIVLVLFGLASAGYIWYRQRKLKSEIEARAWKVNYGDILFLNSKPRSSISSGVSLRSNLDTISLIGGRPTYGQLAFYKSMKVAVKELSNVKIELNHDNLYELKVMKDLSHENLVKFHGACLDGPNCLLTEYCHRGSLQDLLEDDKIKLDWTFRISLIKDLVSGMYYLHRSPIKSHGALKSSNCLVDIRFALKIADFGLSFLRVHDADQDMYNKEYHSFWQRLLWTAPELLNMNPIPPMGTQEGDVYSFGLIMHEILMRKGVFYLGDIHMGAEEILESVKKGPSSNNGTPLRPILGSEDQYEDEVEQLMNRCWAEDSVDRPDFATLKNKLHQMNKNDGNLLDNLLARMEQYASNLEALVDERTADYLEEKRRCEELLYQLLPKSVAKQLIQGESVIAETFDSVTIYFSDIVGFTELSARSTPLEVVELLNDLYTCFDSIVEEFDVYKVETIGDAYMVVSGLPERNGNSHAGEIARMSLALLEAVRKFRIRHRPTDPLKLRIGIHTGPCVAGVVGLKMPRYCLFGDTVNTASRMESNGSALRIHVSPVTKAVLDTFGTFDLECRGEIEIKGKGKMTTYWLNKERISRVTTQPGPAMETKARALSTPLPINARKEMPSNGKVVNLVNIVPPSDEAGIPLLAVTASQDSES